MNFLKWIMWYVFGLEHLICQKKHKEALDKWIEIKKKVSQKIPFDNDWGWDDLRVLEPCGYCEHFFKDCSSCPLGKETYCSMHQENGENTTFWLFVNEMRSLIPDWEKADDLASKMLSRIEQDKLPPK